MGSRILSKVEHRHISEQWGSTMLRKETGKKKQITKQLSILKSGPTARESVFDRERLSDQLDLATQGDRHIVIYGPSGQGKTTLIRDLTSRKDVLLLDCRSSLARKDVYRIILSKSGYSIALERTKTGKFGGKATIKIFGTGFDGDSSGEFESKFQQLQADLTKATEVCALLKETNAPKYVVLNNFDFLSPETQDAIAEELGVFEEQSSLRFVIIGRWADRYLVEKLNPELSGRLEKILVPMWSRDDMKGYLKHCCGISDADEIPEESLEYICDVSNGDIGVFNRICCVYYEALLSRDMNLEALRQLVKEYLVDQFLDINLTRIIDFLFLRDLLVSFSVTRDIVRQRPKTIVADDVDKLEETAKTLGIEIEHTAVQLTNTGKYSYTYREDYTDKQRTDYGVYLGYWLFQKFIHIEGLTHESNFPIEKLISDFSREYLVGANQVDFRKLKKCLLDIRQAQAKGGVFPEFLRLNEGEKSVSISDRQFIAYCQNIDRVEFQGEIQDYIEGISLLKKAKRKNNICMAFDTRSIDEILLAPMALDPDGIPIDPEEGLE